MPKTLKTFDFPHGGRKGIVYDWDSILDGSIWQLEQGTDFDADPKTFVGAVARAANAKNMRVKRQIDGKTLVLQAVPKGNSNTADVPAEASK